MVDDYIDYHGCVMMMLLFIHLSPVPIIGGMEWNGMEWNGMEWIVVVVVVAVVVAVHLSLFSTPPYHQTRSFRSFLRSLRVLLLLLLFLLLFTYCTLILLYIPPHQLDTT